MARHCDDVLQEVMPRPFAPRQPSDERSCFGAWAESRQKFCAHRSCSLLSPTC
ncbi:unnamed protein product [Effrenium voratum]|nr:unnamed protein product [Effrenium voratum]